MGKIDTQFVTKDQLATLREQMDKEIERTGAISNNSVILQKNMNAHITVRLIAKWIIIAILSVLGINTGILNISELILSFF